MKVWLMWEHYSVWIRRQRLNQTEHYKKWDNQVSYAPRATTGNPAKPTKYFYLKPLKKTEQNQASDLTTSLQNIKEAKK